MHHAVQRDDLCGSPDHDGPIAGVSKGGAFLGWLLFADRPRALTYYQGYAEVMLDSSPANQAF